MTFGLINKKKMAAAMLSAIVIAPLAGCNKQADVSLTPAEAAAKKERIDREAREFASEFGVNIESPSSLKSICANLTDGEVSYIAERFDGNTFVVLRETLALNPTVKCEKVAHVVRMLPRITSQLNESRFATERAAILHTAFSG